MRPRLDAAADTPQGVTEESKTEPIIENFAHARKRKETMFIIVCDYSYSRGIR